MVNSNFVCNATTSQAVYEFITGDQMSKDFLNQEASLVTSFALHCYDLDIFIDMRKLDKIRDIDKSKVFDEFWDVMANQCDGGACE